MAADATQRPIFTAILNQLSKARVSDDVAQAQAAVLEAAYTSLAHQAGLEPEALFDRYRLSIRRDAQPQLTETPSFQTWFDGSTVTAPEGAPRRVYHGTDQNFEQFTVPTDEAEPGIFFAGAREVAERYGRNVIPAYLRIRRPYTVTADDWANARGPSPQEAREQGYDGYVIDGWTDLDTDEGLRVPTVAYMVFDPSQIQRETLTERAALLDWFGDSKVVDAAARPQLVFHGTTVGFEGFQERQAPLFFSSDPEAAHEYARRYKGETQAIPAYLRMNRPFDPSDKEGVNRLLATLDMNTVADQMTDAYGDLGPWTPAEVERWLREGSWQVVELPAVLEAIRALGHDGLVVQELGRFNYVVFSHWQVLRPTPAQLASQAPEADAGDRVALRVAPKPSAIAADSAFDGAWMEAPPASQEIASGPADSRGISVLRDEEGQPAVFFKGAPAGLTEFRPNPSTGLIHATSERRIAEQFRGHGQVYSVQVSARRVFDFRNPEHQDALEFSDRDILDDMRDIGLDTHIEMNGEDEALRGFRAGLEDGVYASLELPTVVAAIKRAGFDAFYVREDLQSRGLNIAVFDSQQIRPADPPSLVESQGDSEAFEQWFGDSQVVDDNGRPLVVYHGTDRDFNEFSSSAIGSKHGLDGDGFFFTESKFEAGLYAASDASGGRATKGAIYPVYLSLKNPLVIDDDFSEAQWGTSGPGIVHPARFMENMREEIMAVVKAGSHDGVILRDGQRSMYIAFRPEQIKSAIGNRGTFNSKDRNILFQRATDSVENGVARGAFDRWFAGSAIVDQHGAPLIVYHGTAIDKESFRREGGAAGVGAYFTSDPAVASEYAEGDGVIDGEPPHVMPVYLSIRNPYRAQGIESQAITQERRDELEAQGYDGVIAEFPDGTEYVAFRSEQIKSAIGNRGTFSPERKNILFQGSVTETDRPVNAALAEWFEGSAVVDETGEPLVVYHGTKQPFDRFRRGEEGIFFAASPDTASFYADGDGSTLIPAYLSMKNPLYMTWREWLRGVSDSGLNHYLADPGGLVRMGYDGVILTDPDPSDPATSSVTYIVFEPDQIRTLPTLGLDPIHGPAPEPEPRSFDVWFRGSAVTNENGEPLVVHHGGRFSEEKGNAFHVPPSGAFFAADREVAEAYGRLGQTTSAYLRIKNPFRPEEVDDVDPPAWLRDWIHFWRDEDGWVDRASGEDMSDHDVLVMIREGHLYHYEGIGSGERWRDLLGTASDHHDGFIGNDPTEGVDESGDGRRVFVVFDADQIRLASEVGADQRSQRAATDKGPDRTAFDDWFDGSRITDRDGAPLVVHHGTDTVFQVFDPSVRGAVTDTSDSLEGFWFSASRERALDAAYEACEVSGCNQQYVMDVYLHVANPCIITEPLRDMDPEDSAALIREARDAGHDGVVFASGEQDDPDYVVFESDQIKTLRQAQELKRTPAAAVLAENALQLPAAPEASPVVYHGTEHAFVAFEADGVERMQSSVKGFYFTNDPGEAENYAGTDGRIISATLTLKTPVRLQSGDIAPFTWADDRPGLISAALRDHGGVIIEDDDGRTMYIVRDAGDITVLDAQRVAPDEETLRRFRSEDLEHLRTDSAAFSTWFAGSAVVDEGEQPLVVYHGTANPFAEFQAPPDGLFFTPYPKTAAAFARGEDDAPTARVFPAYLSLRNPLVIDRAWLDAYAETHQVKSAAGRLTSLSFQDAFEDSEPWARDLVFAEAKRLGNDGIVIEKDLSPVETMGGDWMHQRAYVAFDPSQVTAGAPILVGEGLTPPLRDEGDVDDVVSGQAVTFHYVRRTQSAAEHFGVPKTGDPYGRDLEPAGRYMNAASARRAHEAAREAGMEAGVMSFMNPLVIDSAMTPEWKQALSSQFDGLHGKALSTALARAGHDGIVVVKRDARHPYITEVVDLTMFASARQAQHAGHRKKVLFQSAFHGTPHTFERFSLDRAGTGEGAQAFGWGLYFAGKREVAEYYRTTISGRVHAGAPRASDSAYVAAARSFRDAGYARTEALEGLRSAYPDASQRDLELAWGESNPGNLYQVDVPDDSELLDWDKPLNEQPETVRQAMLQAAEAYPKYFGGVAYGLKNERRGGRWDWYKGRDFYDALQDAMRGEVRTSGEFYVVSQLIKDTESAKAASLYLGHLGVPGMRYLDADSRKAGDGTSNYVIWDEARVTVEAVNDQRRDMAARQQPPAPRKVLYQSAFHGTPHQFDRFSLASIGTGEGALSYGWGLYFAGNREVAEHYRSALAGDERAYFVDGERVTKDSFEPMEWLAIQALAQPGIYQPETLLERLDDQGVTDENRAIVRAHLERYEGRVDFSETPNGTIYEVDIPPDDELLDWDKPLKDQPPGVQEKLAPAIERIGRQRATTGPVRRAIQRVLDGTGTGDDLYSRLVWDSGVEDTQTASRYLSDLGIPGLRYLDRESRAANDGTHNYVVWDEARVTVEAINDQHRRIAAQAHESAQRKVLYQSAFHGSPHKFDRFSLEAIGTGEGAQAYGWGLYFAGRREIADYYRKALASQDADAWRIRVDGKKWFAWFDGLSEAEQQDAWPVVEILQDTLRETREDYYSTGRVLNAVEVARSRARYAVESSAGDTRSRHLAVLEVLEQYPFEVHGFDPGHLYRVDLPEDDDLLDWERPLTEQSPRVRENILAMPAFQRLARSHGELSIEDMAELGITADRPIGYTPTGEELYASLQRTLGGQRRASQALNDAGIAGLRYRDATSRNTRAPETLEYEIANYDRRLADETDKNLMPELHAERDALQAELERARNATYNYVIWDDSQISVEAINDEMRQAQELAATQRGRVLAQPAYHGSPHHFDTFSLSAIGTGEGNRSYGWGLYFASKREVAEFYRDALSQNLTPEVLQRVYRKSVTASEDSIAWRLRDLLAREEDSFSVSELEAAGLDPEALDIADGQDEISRVDLVVDAFGTGEGVTGVEIDGIGHADAFIFRDYSMLVITEDGDVQALEGERGHLYQVDLPGDEELLDWDKPLQEQPLSLRQKLIAAGLWSQEVEDRIEALECERASLTKDRDPVTNRMREEQRWHDLSGQIERLRVDQPVKRLGRDLMSTLSFQAYDALDQRDNAMWELIKDDPNRLTYHIDQVVSIYLNSIGIPGLRFLDAFSRPNDAGTYNYVIWDDRRVTVEAVNDEARNARQTPQQQQQENPTRGQIAFDHQRRNFEITLYENADASTVLHESAHMYLEIVRDLVARGEASPQMVKDWRATLDWFGVEKDSDITDAHHEQWARGFEAYVMEGNAPREELTGVFSRLCGWLKDVYTSVSSLGVTLTDGMRDVYGRLLSTEVPAPAEEPAETPTRRHTRRMVPG